MASNSMMQAVLLFMHHQTTTPFGPFPASAAAAVKEPVEDVEVGVPPPPPPEEPHG